MDENTALSLIQVVHNLGGILFAAGPFYALLLLRRSAAPEFHDSSERIIEERFALLPPLWLLLLALQLLSGTGFGLASLVFHGEFPAIGAIARVAISVKIAAVVIAIIISWRMWRVMVPASRQLITALGNGGIKREEALARLNTLRRRREVMVAVLALLSLAALTGAAFLRWNM